MNGLNDYSSTHGELEKNLDAERQRYNQAKKRYNVAAITDFATNLLSLAGYNKGARISLATNNMAGQQAVYDKTRGRYNAALKDYGARIADANLRQKIKQRGIAADSPLKPIGFLNASGNTARTSSGPFSNGTLSRAIKDYGMN